MMLTIDGAFGEGGGQIIRSSLALSLVTGKPFRIYNVRARREKPGLRQQHLTAVKAAALIGGAQVDGAALGSQQFTFVPGTVSAGEYVFRSRERVYGAPSGAPAAHDCGRGEHAQD
jgi:RNA 3'-terminal phosphate cyclase (ATP)